MYGGRGIPDEEDDDGRDDQHQQQDRYTQGLLLVRSFQLTLYRKPECTMRAMLCVCTIVQCSSLI